MGMGLRPKGNWISRQFGPQVRIELADEMVTFSHGLRSLALAPKIYLQGERILAVGDAPAHGSHTEVDVFSPSLADVSADQVLGKFISHGIVTLLNRSFMMRPNLVISLRTTRCPAARVFNAAVLAGAGSVTVG